MDFAPERRYTKTMNWNDKNTKDQPFPVQQRFVDAMVDADIESLARSSEIEAAIAAWDADGVSVEAQIDRLKALLAGDPDPEAATS